MRFADWETWIVAKTEKLLARRKRRRLHRKEKQKRKNQIVDWIQALLWAAVVVLLVNQYLIQGYAVPTGSMEDTIIGEDRLFVNKLVYGPEIIPGFGKLPGAAPARGEIVVFVNPRYEQEMGRAVSGFEQLFHRLVYMITFTLVNLDIGKDGTPAHHFLVKRLIGLPGEQIRMHDGRVEVKRGCETAWTPEEQLKAEYLPLDYELFKKSYPFDKYEAIRKNVEMQTLMLARIRPENMEAGADRAYAALLIGAFTGKTKDPGGVSAADVDRDFQRIVLWGFQFDVKNMSDAAVAEEYPKQILRVFRPGYKLAGKTAAEIGLEYKKFILSYNFTDEAKIAAMAEAEVEAAYAQVPVKYIYLGWLFPVSPEERFDFKTDPYFEDYVREKTRLAFAPQDSLCLARLARRELGWYIPTGDFFPMGDNRDNSKDARYFGSVGLDGLLGRPLFRFWPLNRLGAVKPVK